MAFPSLPSWSSRNPLSILALFIALIYGMAALLFGVAIKSLTPLNQSVLVWFLVLFPVVVLFVFMVLVIYHHWKLYGPGEYRTDDGFYRGMTTNSPALFGARLEEAVDVAESPQGGDPAEAQPPAAAAVEAASPAPEPHDAIRTQPAPSARQSAKQMALLAETLAFQELQGELNGSVRRDVSFARGGAVYTADGFIETEQNGYAVEVSLVRVGGSTLRRVKGMLAQLQGLSIPKILVLIVDEEFVDLGSAQKVAAAALVGHPDVEIRVWGFQALMHKYGLG